MTTKLRSNREDHEIREAMDQEPRSPKLDQDGPERRAARPTTAPPCLALRPWSGMSLIHSILYVLLSILNRIENPLINNFKT